MFVNRLIKQDELKTLSERVSFVVPLVPTSVFNICPYCIKKHSDLITCGAEETAVFVGYDSGTFYYLDEN